MAKTKVCAMIFDRGEMFAVVEGYGRWQSGRQVDAYRQQHQQQRRRNHER
jgi:hypothetical protein